MLVKLEWLGYRMAKNCDDNMLSRFHMVPERNGRTDRFAISVSRVSMLTRDKNFAWGIVVLKLTTDRHEASRDLFTTAELLVN